MKPSPVEQARLKSTTPDEDASRQDYINQKYGMKLFTPEGYETAIAKYAQQGTEQFDVKTQLKKYLAEKEKIKENRLGQLFDKAETGETKFQKIQREAKEQKEQSERLWSKIWFFVRIVLAVIVIQALVLQFQSKDGPNMEIGQKIIYVIQCLITLYYGQIMLKWCMSSPCPITDNCPGFIKAEMTEAAIDQKLDQDGYVGKDRELMREMMMQGINDQPQQNQVQNQPQQNQAQNNEGVRI